MADGGKVAESSKAQWTQATPAGYMPGFGNDFETEALPGALPTGQNSPQRTAYGLYAEQLSGSPFTAPRGANERSWLYRIRPSVKHTPRFKKTALPYWKTGPCLGEHDRPIGQLRWGPVPIPKEKLTFLTGLRTMTTAGDVNTQAGMAAHVYLVTQSMESDYFYNADGEMLVVPQQGSIRFFTEFGRIEAEPGEICIIPRGVKFKVELVDGPARGYVCENYGAKFTLPDRGPIGANCLANARDFKTPVAAFEDKEERSRLTVKWCGGFHVAEIGHSPLDVVAWHGNYAPYKYNLRHYSPVGAILFDHPDPSIYTVLTAPSETAGTANVDFVIFPERWAVAEHTLPPALVPHEHHVGVHGADLRHLRRQARGLRAGRHVAAQLHAAARAGQGGLRPRHQGGAQAGQAHQHAGVHVRDALSPAPDQVCGRAGDAAGGLRGVLDAAGEGLHRQPNEVGRSHPPAAGDDHAVEGVLGDLPPGHLVLAERLGGVECAPEV